MTEFFIERNRFLNRGVKAYYSLDYIGGLGSECQDISKNPAGFIYTLKEDDWSKDNYLSLDEAENMCFNEIFNFFSNVELPRWAFKYPYYVCCVPRSKASFYQNNKKLRFRNVVKNCLANLRDRRFRDGTDFLIRIQDTKMTHVKHDTGWNQGDSPYPGITNDTCKIANEIAGTNIILIDDIYTKTANVIEDCVQALRNKGARDIIVYTVAKTVYNKKFIG